MVWPAVIAAGASLINGYMSNASAKQREQAADARQYNYSKKLWEYQMSNSHQLQVEDLKAAGLNPILSASYGSNTTGNVGGHIASGGNFENVMFNAAQAYQVQKQGEVQDSQVIANEATAKNQTANAAEHAEQARYLRLKNDYIEKSEDAKDAEFGNQNVSHPQELWKGITKDVNDWYERNKKDINAVADRASKYVTGKAEQLSKWFKENSSIYSAKALGEELKQADRRWRNHRQSHPLYGNNYR